MYDEPALHALLLKRLAEKSNPLKRRLYLDKANLENGNTKRQRCYVRELLKLSAEVYVCSGKSPGGCCHCKGVVVDKRWFLTGSSNLTWAARNANSEWCFKLTGAKVESVLQTLQDARSTFPLCAKL